MEAQSNGESMVVDFSSLSVQDSTAEVLQPAPHLSHDPEYNQKRSDPFQFGSRHLKDEADVFEFNAWGRPNPLLLRHC